MSSRRPITSTRIVLLGVLAMGATACASILNFEDFRAAPEDASVDSPVRPVVDAAVDSTVGPTDDGGGSAGDADATVSNPPDATGDARDADAGARDAPASDGCAATLCGCGMALCDGGCVNTTNDRTNCGSCAKLCTGANQVCQASVCTCPAGYRDCSGACLDNTLPITSCGTSCTACSTPGASSYACADGGCVATCPSNLTKCGANTDAEVCSDLTQDPLHCGSCTKACSVPAGSTANCIASVCSFSCNAGLVACPSGTPTACVNVASDPRNCGVCSNACAAPDGGTGKCVDGGCQ